MTSLVLERGLGRVRGIATLGLTQVLGWGTLGCGPEPVEARAIWVDDIGEGGTRRVHVYDRGELSSFEVLGEREPIERVRLDPRGRGVLVRSGDRRGVWFDLEDGRRLPLLLPPEGIGGAPTVGFAPAALTWIDARDGSLALVPLGSGLPLARADPGGVVEPLRRGAGLSWIVPAHAAPVLFVAARVGQAGASASFLRYPTDPAQPLVVALEAKIEGEGEDEGLELPATPREVRSCLSALECYAQLGLDPAGELAIFAVDAGGPWQRFDRRAPEGAGPLALPEALAEPATGSGLRLLAVLDRAVSIWIGAGQLYRHDATRGTVDSLPLFATPPLHWFSVDRGRALILVSMAGPVYRADLDGLRAISLEGTECVPASDPVVSPEGRWVAWTCFDPEAPIASAGGVVVRVSPSGLERYAGVPMATLAIDDAGDLLLYSIESIFSDEVDGVGLTSLPRNLFSLSSAGALTRVDDLEPAPAPVLLGTSALASYIQGVALAGTP